VGEEAGGEDEEEEEGERGRTWPHVRDKPSSIFSQDMAGLATADRSARVS
jgi:hypothetical protein